MKRQRKVVERASKVKPTTTKSEGTTTMEELARKVKKKGEEKMEEDKMITGSDIGSGELSEVVMVGKEIMLSLPSMGPNNGYSHDLEEEEYPWLRSGGVDHELMLWGGLWWPFWEVEYLSEYLRSNDHDDMFSDVVWDDNLWSWKT